MRLKYFAVVVLPLMICGTSSAQSLSGGVSVRLISQFNVTVTQGMNLGKFRAPNNGQYNYFSLNCDGTQYAGGGGGNGAALGGQQIGILTIAADPNLNIQVHTQATGFAANGISIQYVNFSASSNGCGGGYASGYDWGVSTDNSGHAEIRLGAQGQIAPLTPVGEYSGATVQVILTYQ